jgi:DNA-directed RNA polymerase subunit RPC12/RpoP
MALNERDFFTERTERKPTTVGCSKCGHRAAYQVTWIRRTKKDRVPGGADERDRALFTKLRDYLVRVDDTVVCAKCHRKIEIPSHQSLAFDDGRGALPPDDDGEENFNR